MAPITCKQTRTVYFPAPKNASSSLRELFFELDNGFAFRKFEINGDPVDLFWLYKNQEGFKPQPIPDGYESIAVVRDPIERFLSFFKWGILDGNCAIDGVLTVNQLVEDFERLKMSPKARFHLAPQIVFLGADLSYFGRVFTVERLDELTSYLSERAGKTITLPKTNVSPGAGRKPELNNSLVEKLHKIYRADYELLQKFAVN
jgi:hypothetical protein